MVSSGTEETISRVEETYRPMLLRLAWIRLEDPADAEDIVQEVFLRLLTTHPVFQDAKHEKTWLISILLHRAVDFRKAAARKNAPFEDHLQAVERKQTADCARLYRLCRKNTALLSIFTTMRTS